MTAPLKKVFKALLVNSCLALPLNALPFDVMAETRNSQSFIEELYQAHKALTDIGQPGVIKTPGLPLAFFTPEALERLSSLKEAIHPLTGVKTAGIKEVRVTPDSNPDKAIADHVVLVRDDAGLRALRFQLVLENGSFKINNISGGEEGAAWSLMGNAGKASTKIAPAKDLAAAEQAPTSQTKTAEDHTAPASEASFAFDKPFLDPFDGNALSNNWHISNEDRDRYLVENGQILFVASGAPHSLTRGERVNEISLKGAMPDGNYRLSIQLRIEANLVEEKAILALRHGEDDFLAASLFVRNTGCGPELIPATHNSRQIREEEKAHHTYHESRLLAGPFAPNICGKKERAQSDAVLESLKRQGGTLSLVREGHLYRAQMDMQVGGKPLSYQSPFMVRFEPMANPTIYVGKESGNPGSGNVFVSQFEFQPK